MKWYGMQYKLTQIKLSMLNENEKQQMKMWMAKENRDSNMHINLLTNKFISFFHAKALEF